MTALADRIRATMIATVEPPKITTACKCCRKAAADPGCEIEVADKVVPLCPDCYSGLATDIHGLGVMLQVGSPKRRALAE